MDRPLSCNTFYPTTVKVPGHDSWIHYSWVKPWKKTEEDTQYTCEPLGDLRYLFRTTNECHSNDTPKIKFLGIRFIRATLKRQHSLAGVVLQNRWDRSPDSWTRRNLIHLEWDVLFLGKYLQPSLKSLTVLKKKKKNSNPTGSQRTSWRVFRVTTISLWGILLQASGNLELANAPTNPCYHRIDIAYDCAMYY